MAELVQIPLGSQTYQPRSGTTSFERLVNLYPEANAQGAKSAFTLLGTPGLKLFTTAGVGPIRGLHTMAGLIYAVSGNEIYQVDSNGSADLIGSIARTGNVQMTDNGTHVAVATVNELYAVNASSVTLLTETDMNGATFQDGYGIFTQARTQKVFVTNLDDMTTIDPLDFTTADALSGSCIGCISDHRELIIFKESSIEIYYNAGTQGFPFVRVQNGLIEHGCKAPGSIAKAENVVFWLGDDLSVFAMQGYTPQRISTPGIEKAIAGTVGPEGASSFTYIQEGHVFYVLCFSDLTLVYDLSTQKWHEREGRNLNRWRAQHYAKIGEKHIVGDFENGNLYQLDLDTYEDNGTMIVREVIGPPLYNSGSRLFLRDVFIDIEAGVGLTSGQGDDPEAMLSWSDDGGHTWETERTAKIGRIGEYKNRATFSRLGSFFQRSLRLRVSDPVKVAITGMSAKIEGGL